MRQPLVAYLSPSRRCGLPTNVHLQEAADVEQLLLMLLAAGLSFPQLAAYVANGNFAVSQNAADVQLRLDFLQQEGDLTAEESAKAFGASFGYVLGRTSIDSLQRGLKQLEALLQRSFPQC